MEILFSRSDKRHVWDIKNLLLRHDLPTSVNHRVILPFREGYISMKLCKNKTLKNFQIYSKPLFKRENHLGEVVVTAV